MKLFEDVTDTLKSKRQEVIDEADELARQRQRTEFEKGDVAALIIAAFTTIIPLVAIALIAYYIISMLFFA